MNQVSSYRPISLLCTLSKVAKSIILKLLYKFIEEAAILSSHQLLRVAEFISDNLNKRKHTSMLLLDCKQAFDKLLLASDTQMEIIDRQANTNVITIIGNTSTHLQLYLDSIFIISLRGSSLQFTWKDEYLGLRLTTGV